MKITSAMRGWTANSSEKMATIIDKKVVIGKSAGDKEIFVYPGGNGKNNILFICALHGNEIGTAKLGSRLINYLANSKLPAKCFVIQVANPDGFAKAIKNPDYKNGGTIGRFNANNVDLNRNFPTKSFQTKSIWHFGKSEIEVYCGKIGGSEPEIQTIIDFIKKNKINLVFSFHNAGQNIIASDDLRASKIAKIFAQKSGYKLLTQDDWKKYSQTGTFKEWCEENNISFLEIESSNRYQSDWKKIKAAVLQVLNGLGRLKY